MPNDEHIRGWASEECSIGERPASPNLKLILHRLEPDLAVWLRDVLGALDDQHGLGQDASIGGWPIGGVGEAAVSRQALADDLLGRAPAQHALAAGVVG